MTNENVETLAANEEFHEKAYYGIFENCSLTAYNLFSRNSLIVIASYPISTAKLQFSTFDCSSKLKALTLCQVSFRLGNYSL